MNSCLLFDCDGVLVDSEHLCNQGLISAFEALGVQLDLEVLVTRFRGWKLARILEVLSQENRVALPKNFIAHYRALVSQLFETQLQPIEGIKQALDLLPHPKAVVSSGPPAKIQQALRICGLTDYFEGNLFSAYELGVWKPEPDIYLRAAKSMGYAPAHCAVIEDSLVGVEAGYLAGIKTYFYNPLNLPHNFPRVISFPTMCELPNLLTNQ